MKWIKYSILTTTEAEDFISLMLSDLGIEGVEIENNVPLTEDEQKGMFIDFPPELAPDDGSSVVSFYVDEDMDQDALMKNVMDGLEEQRQFVNIGAGTIRKGETEDKDWINNWKEYFHSFTIGNILIKPTWEEVEDIDRDKTLIEIDPGISFGTGKHETTQLCITQLQKYLKEGDEVLDVGCGSGILSIAALKLGAGHVVGTDIDENCITSSYDNFDVNKLSHDLGDFYFGNLIDDKNLVEKVGTECYDIVTANILADVIIPMAPIFPDRMKKGAKLITSGIIDFKENEVKTALENVGLKIVEINHLGEWVNITAEK